MCHRSFLIGIFAVTCGLLANAAPARAVVATWVSGTGSDAGSCPITAPCRSFAFALSQTNANGVINVLSAGNLGPLTITKSISIVADGVEAAILGAGDNSAAIIIQAAAGDIVSLRGLTIDLRGTNKIGISFLSGAALHVQNSVIRNSNYGILFAPASGTSELHVADSVIADTSGGGDGIRFQPTGSAGGRATLDRVRVENASGAGMVFSGTVTTGSVTATVRDSVSAGSVGTGILAQESGSGTTTVMIDRTASVNNSTGIYAIGAAATIRIGDSTVAGNGTALATGNSGVINSYQTNQITGSGDPNNIIPMK